MSLINEALNKSRNDAAQNHILSGVGANGTQIFFPVHKGGKGVKKRKTSILSISILGTILAGTIAFYCVCSFTDLIPQFSRKEVKIGLKDTMDFAPYVKVSKETAPVPESIQDVAKVESQSVEKPVIEQGEGLEEAKAETSAFTPPANAPAEGGAAETQIPEGEVEEAVSSSVTNVMEPTQEGEKQVQGNIFSPPIEIQAVESSASIPSLRAEGEAIPSREVETQVSEGVAEQEVQALPASASGEQNNDTWYAAYHFGMGVFYQKNKEYEKAVEEYNKVIKFDPNNAEVHINLGVIYKDKGDLDKAVEEYEKALAVDPGLEMGHNNLGVVYFLKGNYAEAIRHYQKAVEINPKNLESYTNLGIAYGIQKRNDEAIKAFQTAISINPQHAEAQYNLAIIYDENGEITKALFYYSKFLELYHTTQSELVDRVKRRIEGLANKLRAKNMGVP